MNDSQRGTDKWGRLAEVARERAMEQKLLMAAAATSEIAGPHAEQRAYLLKLAETYERRRVAGRSG